MIFTKSGLFFKNSKQIYTDNQIVKKEILPVWIKPHFPQCKDNTFTSEMQIRHLGCWTRICEKLLHFRTRIYNELQDF